MNDEVVPANTPFPQMGQLGSVSVRSVWPKESLDFTPWLAQPENLHLLASCLQLGSLAVEGTEVSVGNFFIDILARDCNNDIVIIENQFGKTDHTHLGQIITYLAGQQGSVTVVWVAENFREEHRAAVDWLNANTLENMNFFAAEVEVLKIGESLPAPWFNIVAKPNGWSRGVKRATQTAAAAPENEGQAFNLSYWQAFANFLSEKQSPLKFKTPNKQRYAYVVVATSLLAMNAWIKPNGPSDLTGLAVDLWIGGSHPKELFNKLLSERDAIEEAIGEPLNWEEKPETKGSRIVVATNDFRCDDENTWPQQFEWLLLRMTRLRDVFRDRVMKISQEISL